MDGLSDGSLVIPVRAAAGFNSERKSGNRDHGLPETELSNAWPEKLDQSRNASIGRRYGRDPRIVVVEAGFSKLNCVMKREPYGKSQSTSCTETDPAAEAVDVVYTWVDARNPSFRAALRWRASAELAEADLASAGLDRYRNYGELRFSLRSLLSFAPWVRRIHILTNGQVPSWLNSAHPQIRLVTHAEVFPEPEALPTFNSNAIEMCLHRIPGLARRFIYFNDDVFLGRAVRKSDFFLPDGGQMVFLEDTLLGNNCRQGSARDRACAYTQAILTRLWGQPQAPRLLPAHTPQAYDRDLLAHLESSLHDEFRRTATHRFRSGDDLVLSALYAYTLLEAPAERGRHEAQVLPKLSHQYYMLELETKLLWMMRAYADILRKRPTFFCLNDILGEVPAHHPVLLALLAFLHLYFRKSVPVERAFR
jgi:hypothetical protein